MQIKIKKALLEGHQPEIIIEAVHANHPNLNKSTLKNPNTSYIDGKNIENNRKELSNRIKDLRSQRDIRRKEDTTKNKSVLFNAAEQKNRNNKIANEYDNSAREISQTGGFHNLSNELKPFNNLKSIRIMRNVPRVISSAKQ